ncbi:MAG: PorT family protein [Saprospiraceae bacterium]|nr:PorT family protein [Saprospiraceae bacterium]
MKRFFIGLSLLSCVSFLQAQDGWEAGFWLGTTNYFGDLNTSYDLSRPGLSGGIIARYNFNKRVAIKFSGSYGSVSADDAESSNAFERARNLSFESPIVDATAQFEFNFLPYTHGSKDEFFTPYLFAGLSGFYFNPKATFEGEVYELRELGTEGQFKGEEYYTVQGALTYGGGIKVDLSYEWSLNVEIGARYLFTDYLDDVSTVYPDREDLLRDRGEIAVALSDRSVEIEGFDDSTIGQPGTQRGNSNNNDTYIMFGVGLLYYFGDLKCPTPSSRGF